MPRLKQPSPLDEQAFGILVNHVVNNCHKISVAGKVDLLKKNVAALKEHLHHNLHPMLLLKFCKHFVSRFNALAWIRCDKRRPEDRDLIVFKILLDSKIIGLKLTYQLMLDMELFYIDGLLEWQVLNMSAFRVPNLTVLEDFRLRNLTELVSYDHPCDDDFFKIIGSHCTKLQVLEINLSENVTDEGLRVLGSCTELRVIHFVGCFMKDSRINDILSIHKKLEEFRIRSSYGEPDQSFDVLTRERTLVCPSLKKFTINCKESTLTHEHLTAVVELFPNLSDLEIASNITSDILHVLKGLKKLTRLAFKYPVTYKYLEKFLMEIGENITKLSIVSPSPRLIQMDLKLVYKHCSNIEILIFESISYKEWQKEDKLVIPPFRKLKHLHCVGPSTSRITEWDLALEITELPKIETLICQYISSRGAVRMVDSMMFDHIKFPNLKLARTSCLLRRDVDRINELAKNNNLDFRRTEFLKMPGFKQPPRLERIAFYYLLKSVVGYCDKLSIDGTLSQLREGVSFIKRNVIANLPAASFPEFIKNFFYKFYRIGLSRSNVRPDSHCRAILELTMDVDVVGLRCGGDILRHLSPRDAHRFRGLKVLDLSGFWESTPRRLGNFRLEELTILILPRFCTDLDLEVIGSRCPKLQVLDIEESVKVTDRGLRFLNSCTELRVANLRSCAVSDKGINELLSFHNQLEEFNVGRYYTRGEKGFDVLSREISDVCPSVKRFSIKTSPVTDAHLSSIVKIFPNLIHLRICCQVTGDLRTLKGLRKLRELNFSYGYRCFRMTNLKELLLIDGENLHVLNMHHCFPSVSVNQNDLDYIFQYCANLEYLEFDYEPDAITENLVIPPFKKLKTLKCTALDKSGVLLKFSKILELETLVIHGFEGVFQLTESMMLDHVNFPKLKEIRTFYNSEESANRIVQIARDKNLDFSFKFEQ